MGHVVHEGGVRLAGDHPVTRVTFLQHLWPLIVNLLTDFPSAVSPRIPAGSIKAAAKTVSFRLSPLSLFLASDEKLF